MGMMLRLLVMVCILAYALTQCNDKNGKNLILPQMGNVKSAECKIMACENGMEAACITNEEAAKIPVATACTTSPADICYKQYGACIKNETGCGWKPSAELENCVNMVKAAEALKNRKFEIPQ